MSAIYTKKNKKPTNMIRLNIVIEPDDAPEVIKDGHYVVFIEATPNPKVYVEIKEKMKQIPINCIVGRLLWCIDSSFGMRNYVALISGEFFDITSWSSQAMSELLDNREYAKQATNIEDLRQFLEL